MLAGEPDLYSVEHVFPGHTGNSRIRAGLCQPTSQMPFHVSAKFMFNSLPNVRLVPLTGPQELEHRSGSRACSSPKGCLAIPLSGAVVEVLLNSVTGH